LNGLGSSALISGNGIDIVSASLAGQRANISMLNDTTEDTTGDKDDVMLIADGSTGKVIKYIKLKNLRDGTSFWNEVSDADNLEFYLYPDGGASFNVLIGKTSPISTSNKLEVLGATLLTGATTLDGTLTLKNNGATNGQILIGNTTGNTLSLANLTAGSNVSITNGAGSITIASTNTTYTGILPIEINGSNQVSLKDIDGYDDGKFLKSGDQGLSWAAPTDTNHWTIFDTRKIKPSTSSINYLFLENTAADNSLNPAIQLKSSNSSSYIYNEYTNTALTLEQGNYKLRIKNNGNFEFSESNTVFFTIKPSTAMNLSQFINNVDFITSTSTSTFTNKSGNISQWTNNSSYITASSTDTLTNKSGNISQWTNDSGYITSISGAIESAVNVSTAGTIPATLRTFGNSSSTTRIAGVNVAIDTIKTQSTSNFGIIFDYWTGSVYTAGKSIKPVLINSVAYVEIDYPVITGTSGDANRMIFKDLNHTDYLFIKVPDLTSDINLTLPSTTGTFALTSQLPSVLSGGTNITIVDNVINLDQQLINLADIETNGAYFLGNNAAEGGYIFYTQSTTSSGANSAKTWMCYQGTGGDFHWEYNNSTSTYALKGFVGTSASSGSFKQMNFTGSHRCITENQSILNNIDDYVGMVVCATGDYNVIVPEGDDTTEISVDEAQPIVELSTNAKDKRVYGVISNKEKVGERRNFGSGLFMSVANEVIKIPRLIINSIGEGGILVCNQGGHIWNGDLLCSSDIQGIAMKQDSDFIMNYTIGKATQDYIFESSIDYKLIGCVYYAG
jgi:hypothetical protein